MTHLPAHLWTRADNGRLIRVNRLIFAGQPGCRAPVTHLIASHKSPGDPRAPSFPPERRGTIAFCVPPARAAPGLGRAGPGGSAPPAQGRDSQRLGQTGGDWGGEQGLGSAEGVW